MRHLIAALILSAATPVWAGTVSLTTSDSTTIAAHTWGEGDKGVVLVHGANESAESWAYFADRLATRGFHVIAVDLRGHGASADAATLSSETWPKMVEDIHAASAWLRENGASSVHLVGAEVGANLVVHAGASDEAVTDIALLSPGMNLEGIASPTMMETYGDRPSLIVSSTGDGYGARSAGILESKAQGRVYVEMLDGDAKGVRLLTRDPQLEGKLIAWLNGTYDLDGQRASRTVTTEAGEDVETSGVRFGD